MNFNRKEHGRFIQYLDRTAEKNPLLWLPCVALIALALAAEHIVAHLHNNTEKDIRKIPQSPKKPFFLRAVAVTLTAAFSLMLVPAASFDAFGEEYAQITEQVDFNEVSEDKEISDAEKPTVTEESADTEEPTDDEETAGTNEPTDTDEEPTDTEEPADADEPTDNEETADNEEPTSNEEEAYVSDMANAVSLYASTNEKDHTGHRVHSKMSYNNDEHWNYCDTCDEEFGREPHASELLLGIQNPTATKQGYLIYGCKICEFVIRTEGFTSGDLQHQYGDWEYNELRHWKPCLVEDCNLVSEFDNHDWEYTPHSESYYKDFHYRTCTTCGYVERYIPHNWGNWKTYSDEHCRTCKDCGYEDRAEHNYPQEPKPYDYKSDDTNHWLECSFCGYKKDKKRHTIDVEQWQHDNDHHRKGCTVCTYATVEEEHTLKWETYDGNQKHREVCEVCDVLLNDGAHIWQWTSDAERHWQKCNVCPETKNEAKHTFSEEWSFNGTYHWHECTYVTDEKGTVCGRKKDMASHTADISVWYDDEDGHWRKCSACGTDIRKTKHTYTRNNDDTAHWDICSDCGRKDHEAFHSYSEPVYTYDEDGVTPIKIFKCVGCDYSYTELIWHEHDFFDELGYNELGHWHDCKGCDGKIDGEAHNYIITVDNEPTETTEGTRVYTCKDCHYSYDETIPETGHTHNFSTEWKRDGSEHWHECVCGQKSGTANHDYNIKVTIEPTETTEGTRVYTCKNCQYSYDETIPELGHTHNFSTEWKRDGSEHWHECVCGEKSGTANHDYNIKVTIEPTETTEGTRVYTCKDCQYSYDETIPELGHTHSFGTEWHNDENDHWKKCTACDEKTDIAPHVSDGGTVTVQPTSTSEGVKSYKCSICGYIIKTEPIPALAPIENVTVPVYYPPITVTEAPMRLPYVTNVPEIKGWENIAAHINASPDGVTIPITMNGETEMPKKIAECIMSRNITLSIKTNTGPVWTVNGLDVTAPKTVNLRVSERFNKIPASVTDDLISEFKPKEYRLYHSGDFGFKATLTLNVGKKYNNYYAALYHYNIKTRQLEFVDESFVKNRQVTFELTHASAYAVAFNSVSMYDDVSSGAGVFESSIPIETSAMPETSGVTVPAVKLPQIMKYSNKKRRYRILKKRRLDDLVFVF